MDVFNAVCPGGKSVSYVDDLKTFTVAVEDTESIQGENVWL